MSTTKIEWATHTVNPMTGCTPASEGCANCYARRTALRLAHNPMMSRAVRAKYEGFRPAQFHEGRLDDIQRLPKGARAFVGSMTDLFHEQVNLRGPELLEIFRAIAASEATCIVLTKRVRRMAAFIRETYGEASEAFRANVRYQDEPPLRNLWLGVSAENQARAEERIPELLKISAARRLVSLEPLLGPVDLGPWLELGRWDSTGRELPTRGIDWVIVGGESGPDARPTHPDWVRDVRDQCAAAGVPFFFKGWGEWGPTSSANCGLQGGRLAYPKGTPGVAMLRDGRHVLRDVGHDKPLQVVDAIAKAELDVALDAQRPDPREPDQCDWLGYHWLHRLGKRVTGRQLDGRTWEEVPR